MSKQACGATSSAAVALSHAGAISVGAASEIASSVMTKRGVSDKDITHIADLLAASGRTYSPSED